MHSGQACIRTERVLVEASVADRFINLVATEIARLRQAPPPLARPGAADVDVGAITFAPQVERAERQIADAVARGGRVVTGGTRRTDLPGRFFAPTLIADATTDMDVMREEAAGQAVRRSAGHHAPAARDGVGDVALGTLDLRREGDGADVDVRGVRARQRRGAWRRRATSVAARSMNRSATLASTSTRSVRMQTCPLFAKPLHTAACAARGRSASASTIIGDLPPSSSTTASGAPRSLRHLLPRRCAAGEENHVGHRGQRRARVAASRHHLEHASGTPAVRASSAMRSDVSGVCSDGLRTTALPAASGPTQSA